MLQRLNDTVLNGTNMEWWTLTVCRTQGWLDRHKKSDKCPDGGINAFRPSRHKLKGSPGWHTTPVHTRSKDLAKLAIERSVHAKTIRDVKDKGTAARALLDTCGSGMQQGATDSDGAPAPLTTPSGQYLLMDGTHFSPPVIAHGACEKGVRGPAVKYTHAQLEFLKVCYTRGLKHKGSKVSPTQAEELMRLHGTKLTENRFPGEDYWKASATGQPTFRVSEQLEHHVFRMWFGQQKAAFDAKLAATMRSAEQNVSALISAAGAALGDDIGDG